MAGSDGGHVAIVPRGHALGTLTTPWTSHRARPSHPAYIGDQSPPAPAGPTLVERLLFLSTLRVAVAAYLAGSNRIPFSLRELVETGRARVGLMALSTLLVALCIAYFNFGPDRL